MDAIRKGILFALIGTILFSTKAIFVKLAYRYDVDAISLLLLRMLFAIPFYMISLIIFRNQLYISEGWKRKWLVILVATALLGYYLSSLFDFIGLRYIDASIERLILYIFPSIVVLLSFFIFKERIRGVILLVLLLTYVGLILVFIPELSEVNLENDFWKGTLYIGITAITFALFYLGNQYLIPKLGALQFTNISMIIAGVAVIIHYTVVSNSLSMKLFALPFAVYVYGFLMAFVSTVIPSYFVSYSIKYIGASNSSIVSSFGPIATIILAYFVLGERLTGIQLLGGAIIIVSISLLRGYMRSKK